MNMNSNIIRAAVITAALSMSCAAFAVRMTAPNMNMEQLTDSADEIVIGNVVKAQTEVIDRRFETNYTIQVHDTLKTRSGLAAGGEFIMTLPGGALTSPPLTQYVGGIPYMVEGEEVVLFLRQPANPPSATRSVNSQSAGNLSSSFTVVGWNQGRFSVVADPQSGEQLVTRMNLEDYGLMNTAEDTREILKAVREKQLRLVKRQVVPKQGAASTTRQKDPLELTPVDQSKLTVEQRQQAAENMQRRRERGGIPVQSLDSFRQQVLEFVNK